VLNWRDRLGRSGSPRFETVRQGYRGGGFSQKDKRKGMARGGFPKQRVCRSCLAPVVKSPLRNVTLRHLG